MLRHVSSHFIDSTFTPSIILNFVQEYEIRRKRRIVSVFVMLPTFSMLIVKLTSYNTCTKKYLLSVKS